MRLLMGLVGLIFILLIPSARAQFPGELFSLGSSSSTSGTVVKPTITGVTFNGGTTSSYNSGVSTGTSLGAVVVTMSDGSTFNGALSLVNTPTITGVSVGGGLNPSYQSGIAPNTTIGAITVNETAGTFGGTLSLGGTGASNFGLNTPHIPSNLIATSSTPTCTTSTNYQITITPTQTGVINSGTAYPITVTCNPATTPSITSISLSNSAFATGSSGTVGTLSSTVSGGSPTITYSITSSGVDSSGNTCNNYTTDGFSTSGTSLNFSSTTPPGTYPGFCVTAAATGYNSYTQAFTLTGTASGTPTHVAWAGSFNYGTPASSLTATRVSGTIAVGDCLLVGVYTNIGNATTISVTGQSGDSFLPGPSSSYIQTFYLLNAPAGGSVITAAGTNIYGLLVDEYTHCGAYIDGSSANSGNSAAPAPGSFTTTQNGDLIWAANFMNTYTDANSPGSGFSPWYASPNTTSATAACVYNGSTCQYLGLTESEVQGSAGSISPAFTSTSDYWFSGALAISTTQPSQLISSISPTSCSVATGATGTCETVSVTMQPTIPKFSGTLSVGASGGGCTDTTGGNFAMSGANLNMTNSSTPAGSYTGCIKLTQASASNSPAYKAVAITVYTATGGTCGAPPVGAAAADVQSAGFTTCALYNDWTYGLPNSQGTGQLSNASTWLDCSQNGGDNPNNPWTLGMGWYNQGFVYPCAANGNSSNSIVYEDTDSSGNKALHIHFSAATQNDNISSAAFNGWVLSTGPYTYNNNPNDAHLGVPASWNFPMGVYVEVTWADNLPYANGGYGNGPGFWTYGTPAADSTDYLEMDFDEVLDGSDGRTTVHTWPANPNNYVQGFNAQMSGGAYSTQGFLITNDGSGTIGICVYINGSRQGCPTYGTDDTEVQARMPFWWGLGLACSHGSCTTDDDTWIKYIKVYSCANWLTSNPAAACSGTSFNGNFYTP